MERLRSRVNEALECIESHEVRHKSARLPLAFILLRAKFDFAQNFSSFLIFTAYGVSLDSVQECSYIVPFLSAKWLHGMQQERDNASWTGKFSTKDIYAEHTVIERSEFAISIILT